MNKKLIAIAALVLPCCALANDNYPAHPHYEVSDFYIRGHVGGAVFNRFKVNPKEEGDIGATMKSKTTPFIGVGVGYYLMETVRTDLTFEHHFNPGFKTSVRTENINENYKSKAMLDAIMLNGYVDLFNDFSSVGVFAGGGIGVAKLKEKCSVTVKHLGIQAGHPDRNVSASSKTTYNFAYSLTAGVSVPITEGLRTELSYSWKDFGKTKPRKNSDGEQMTPKSPYKGHNISLGLRLNI